MGEPFICYVQNKKKSPRNTTVLGDFYKFYHDYINMNNYSFETAPTLYELTY